MTAIAILRGPDAVVIATDGAGYDERGILGAHVTKIALMPEWSCAFANRGMGLVTSRLHGALQHMAFTGMARIEGFDDVLALLPVLSPAIHADLLQTNPGVKNFSLMIGGYSESRSRFETYSLRSRNFDKGWDGAPDIQPAFTLAPLPAIHFAPMPSDDACRVVGMADVTTGNHDGRSLAVRAICAARLDRGGSVERPADEDHSIGAFVQLTIIGQGSINSQIVHRWPDRLGESINPSRGDLLPSWLQ